MSTAPSFTCLGYCGPAVPLVDLTPKHVASLWCTPSGGRVVVAYTGSYWSIEPWARHAADETPALRRRAAALQLHKHPCLGRDATSAAWRCWKDKEATPATEKQGAFLQRLGAPLPQPAPQMLVGAALSGLQLLRSLERGEQLIGLTGREDLDSFRAACRALKALPPEVSLSDWWEKVEGMFSAWRGEAP